jgi:hypothetical protein
MSRTSRESAPEVTDVGIVEDRSDHLDDYSVGFTTFRQEVDHAPLLKGLPDDRCQCPHWGYLFTGRMTIQYADHNEVVEAGDAYYMPPGHVPIIEAGTELLMFSPTAELKLTDEVLMKNVQAMMAEGGGPPA